MVMVIQVLAALRALRKMSPSGVWCQTLRSVIIPRIDAAVAGASAENCRAMIAALIAPIETPDTKFGSISASCSA